MSYQRYVWILLAASHLAVTVCGASYLLPDRSTSRAMQTIQWYATVSGAGSHYGYFAPEVGAKHRARVVFGDVDGSTWEGSFDQTDSPEARLRLTGIVEGPFMTGQTDQYPEWRRQLVKSWAATMFTRERAADSLRIEVEFYRVPTIAEYRTGSRPSWETLYHADFQQRPLEAAERTDQ